MFESWLAKHDLEFQRKEQGYRGLKTKIDILKGTTIFKDDAIGIYVQDRCMYCLAITSLKRCKCKLLYCSRECQLKDYSIHKSFCGKFSLESQILLQQVISRDVLEFSDLVSHFEHLDIQMQSMLIEQSRGFPVDSHLHLSRFLHNNFTMHDESLFTFGQGVFVHGSLLNHSCIPNCVVWFVGRVMVCKAITDIPANEELFISYVDPILDYKDRSSYLEKRYHFKCTCIRCVTDSALHVKQIDFEILDFHSRYRNLSYNDYLEKLSSLKVAQEFKDITVYKHRSNLLDTETDPLALAQLSKFLLCFQILRYPPYHPIISLYYLMLISHLYNAGINITDLLSIAKSNFRVSHGDLFPCLARQFELLE